MIPVNMNIENSISRGKFDSRDCSADSQKWLSQVSVVDVLEVGFDGYVGAELLHAYV